MRKTFDDIIQKNNDFSFLLEDVLNLLPAQAKHHKLKLKVEAAFKATKRAMERHDTLISDSVPKVKVKTDSYDSDFLETWATYKEYMIEQFGVRMGSRMQVYRLELLFDYANKDIKTATKWLKFYMANGSINIYPVNELKIEQNADSKTTKATFTLPGNSK